MRNSVSILYGPRAFSSGATSLECRQLAFGLISAMQDLVMLAIGIGAFAVTILYVLACDRL
jgi:hypothetical protein